MNSHKNPPSLIRLTLWTLFGIMVAVGLIAVVGCVNQFMLCAGDIDSEVAIDSGMNRNSLDAQGNDVDLKDLLHAVVTLRPPASQPTTRPTTQPTTQPSQEPKP